MHSANLGRKYSMHPAAELEAYPLPALPHSTYSYSQSYETVKVLDLTDVGHANMGFSDDERVYIDDGYDEPVDGEEEDIGEFSAAPPPDDDDDLSPFSSAGAPKPQAQGQRRRVEDELSPMIFQKRATDDEGFGFGEEAELFSDEEEDNLRKGVIGERPPPVPAKSKSEMGHGSSATMDGFVFISKSNAADRTGRHGRSTSRGPRTGLLSPNTPQNHPVSPTEFDILGDELEMSFASNPSPTRRDRETLSPYILGLEGERSAARGRMGSRANPPPRNTSHATQKGKALRRYASEESL
ncbi:hypothetical protein MPER_01148, partial [Moniliophthora perniciosa FA553]